jgi:hypothetical protein
LNLIKIYMGLIIIWLNGIELQQLRKLTDFKYISIFFFLFFTLTIILLNFKVKRPGDKNVRCTILLLLDYQPLQFKLDQRLARLLGVHTQTRPVIISALWQFIKTHKLQVKHYNIYFYMKIFLIL